jgi:phosphatidylglycerol:prolipoprotein diacylglycerol transferase
MALTFPDIDPVAVKLGPLAIRWYALAYIAGLTGGWRYFRWLAAKSKAAVTALQIDDFLVWATMGTVLGGRLGYVLFYKPDYYFADPIEILSVWHGGMSFHGGITGVIVATILFCRKNRLALFEFGDLMACVAPIGLFFGRVANFINGELYGRIAPDDLPWAMVFPNGGPEPRHPSQLYEALGEGLILGLVLHVIWRSPLRARRGFLAGMFLLGYGVARSTVELFREPDGFLGFFWGFVTMGQILSLPLILAGLAMIALSRKAS